jgi:hypothetical protein
MATGDYANASPPLNDTKVDNIGQVQTGVIDELTVLSIDIPDIKIVKNLDQRIQDSQDYWNTTDGFNLEKTRNDNKRLYIGKALDTRSLYRFQMPYVENQIYIAEQAIKAYLTSQTPQSEVAPAQDTPSSKQFAIDLEKIHISWSQMMALDETLEHMVQNGLNMRGAFGEFEWDPNYGANGEIVFNVLNPEHCVVDKNAEQSDNPAFFAIKKKASVNELCSRWPEKKDEIYKECGIVRGTYAQLESVVDYWKVYLTYYDKKYEAQEAVVYYFGDLVLEKNKDPNWLYSNPKRNFLKVHTKPIIPLNFDNDGSHWIDSTSAVEQASSIQSVLNKRGRQLMEVADKANGILIVSQDSGLTKDDLQNLTGDPNQRLIIKTMGKDTQSMVYQVPPPEVPNFLYQDKVDLRTTVHAIMGTPSEFTGSNDGDAHDETLGQSLMKKNQASGRQDLYVRCLDRFLDRFYNMLTQMMVVWYDTEHYFVYNGGDGEFDHLVASRYLFEDGMQVSVKSGSTPPLDKEREEAIALSLMKEGAISPLDLYKMLHLPKPQKLYDNMSKYKADPMSLARDAMDELDETKAYMDYTIIMAGKKAEEPKDVNKEYILTCRKLMLTDEFLKADKKLQTAYLKHVEKAISSLELRTSLDIMSKEGIQLLEPQQPIQPLPPPVMQPAPGMMPPQGMPGMPPAPGGAPMPPGQPGMPPPQGQPPQGPLQGMPMPPQPQGPPPIQNGTPLMNPSNPMPPGGQLPPI